jgi:protease-4
LEKFAALRILNDIAPVLKPLNELAQMNDPQGIYVKCLDCVAP